jgi:hypothetical protein
MITSARACVRQDESHTQNPQVPPAPLKTHVMFRLSLDMLFFFMTFTATYHLSTHRT